MKLPPHSRSDNPLGLFDKVLEHANSGLYFIALPELRYNLPVDNHENDGAHLEISKASRGLKLLWWLLILFGFVVVAWLIKSLLGVRFYYIPDHGLWFSFD